MGDISFFRKDKQSESSGSSFGEAERKDLISSELQNLPLEKDLDEVNFYSELILRDNLQKSLKEYQFLDPFLAPLLYQFFSKMPKDFHIDEQYLTRLSSILLPEIEDSSTREKDFCTRIESLVFYIKK